MAADLLASCIGASCVLAVNHQEGPVRYAQRPNTWMMLTSLLRTVQVKSTEVTHEAWTPLDSKCRLARSKVLAHRAHTNTWMLAETGLSKPEGTGEGRCMRWSQSLDAWFVLWNTLILQMDTGPSACHMPRDVCKAKLPHVVGGASEISAASSVGE